MKISRKQREPSARKLSAPHALGFGLGLGLCSGSGLGYLKALLLPSATYSRRHPQPVEEDEEETLR